MSEARDGKPPTVASARSALARQLAEAGIDTPALDARVLMQFLLGTDHAGLVRDAARILSAEETQQVAVLGARRLAREPVAHIVGEKEFWGLALQVTTDTLVPRPDSETLVEAALAHLERACGRGRPLRIADIGTGTGALLLALLSELPRAFGVGTDRSMRALAVASQNAERHHLAQRGAFVLADFAAPLAGAFDLVVSNPPYVETAAIATLEPEVRRFEPHIALDGGPDGLAAYRVLAADARRLLAPGGALVIEVGSTQAAQVANLFTMAGWKLSQAPVDDLSGRQRALVLGR